MVYTDEIIKSRIDTLRIALKHPNGIDLIMEQMPIKNKSFRKFLCKQAKKVDEMSEHELLATVFLISVESGRKKWEKK